jgi:hypothetical protein
MTNLPVSLDFIGTIVAALLTFFVLGYLLGDLPGLGGLFKFLYRLVMHVLIGAGIAYALIVAWWSILYPRIVERLLPALAKLAANSDPQAAGIVGLYIVGGALGLMFLLTKSNRQMAGLGNLVTGYLVGVGLGVSIGGAVLGTLFAQVQATAMLFGASGSPLWFPIDSLLLVVGTVTTLVAFSFTVTARRGPLAAATRLVQGVSVVGRFFLYVAFGAIFAGVYAASVAVLVGRLQFLISAISRLFQ